MQEVKYRSRRYRVNIRSIQREVVMRPGYKAHEDTWSAPRWDRNRMAGRLHEQDTYRALRGRGRGR